MTFRRIAIHLVSVLGVALAVALGSVTSRAAGFEYSSEKREIKVGELLVQSAKAAYAQPPGRVNLENPDPHMFWVLERSPFKPANWEFVNPLAPSVVTQEVLERWDFRYRNGGGFGDPFYANGDPTSGGTRVVKLGDPVTKDTGAYWEVLLSEENFNALLTYDLLFVTNHSLTAFTPAERNLLRRLVDAGAAVYVDDCGGMRIVHANELGQVPVTDFLNPGSQLTPDGKYLADNSDYFRKAYFTSWGGGPSPETGVFDYDVAPLGFLTPLEFNDDPPGSGWARVADPFHPLLRDPYWLSQDELNEIGDKGITSYRISAYSGSELFPVVANSAFDAPTAHAPYGQPHIAMGYFGEGLAIACGADVGCAIQDKVTGGRFYQIGGEWNSGYWCGSDFTLPDTDPRFIGSVKLMMNAVNLAARWRGGFGGPRQQGSTAEDIPNGFTASSSAQMQNPTVSPLSSSAGWAGGHSYATASQDVVYQTVPLPGSSASGRSMVLMAIDAEQGRDLDGDGNPDDGVQGTPTGDLAPFSYPEFDVIWAVAIPGSEPGGAQITTTATAPCIGKAAYDTGGGIWESRDIVYLAVNDHVYAYVALPTAPGGRLLDVATLFAGWTTNPVSLPGRATGLTYSRGRLYASCGGTLEIYVLDAGSGTPVGGWPTPPADRGRIHLPGTSGTLCDTGAGPAVALVADQYNGAIDETVYIPTSPDNNNGTFNPSGQLVALVTRSWDERLKPVGSGVLGQTDPGGGNDRTVANCHRFWRIRDFARFRVTTPTTNAGQIPDVVGHDAADQALVTVYVNGTRITPDRWEFVADTVNSFRGGVTGGADGDWQEIRFTNGPDGKCLAGVVPGGTNQGVPPDAAVTVDYEHAFPRDASFPLSAVRAGSIKWRYIFTKRISAFQYARIVSAAGQADYAHTKVSVGQDGTVVVAVPIPDSIAASTSWSDTIHVLRDWGYPTDLRNVRSSPSPPSPDPDEPWPSSVPWLWNGDEVDGVGSFVFWQESQRPHLGYVIHCTENPSSDRTVVRWMAPSVAIRGTQAVVRTAQTPRNPDDPDLPQAASPFTRYSSYTMLDLSASMSVILGKGTGNVTAPPVPLSSTWTTGAMGVAYPNDYRPFGVRVFDEWSMVPMPYTTLTGAVDAPPTTWWVDPVRGTIHFKLSTLAGRRVLVQVCDNKGTPNTADDVYYHEYHEIPPVVIGQYPSMAVRVGSAVVRPRYNGGAIAGPGSVTDPMTITDGGAPANPATWVTPFHIDWDSGVLCFAPTERAQAATITSSAGTTDFVISRVNVDVPSGDTAILDPQIMSEAAPVVSGDKVVVNGYLDNANGSLFSPNSSVSDGVLVLALDPRDSAFQDTANEPWPGASPPWWPGGSPSIGAPWASYAFSDQGAVDRYIGFWGAHGVIDPWNPNYDLLGEGRGASVAFANPQFPPATTRTPPVVTAAGVMTSAVGPWSTPIPRYQWWAKQDTAVAGQNRLLVVDSGRAVVRDIPSTGLSEVLGNIVLPGTLEATQGSFKGISRPTSLRELGYVGKPGSYHLCDSGNDQVIEISKTGTIQSRISNRLRPAFSGDPGGYIAFYDVPGWYVNLPAGAPRTIAAPNDAYRWEFTDTISVNGVPADWRFEFDWIADTGNSRLLGLMRQVPSDPSIVTGRRDQYHLVWYSDPFQALLDQGGKMVQRGPALQYVTSWPLRLPTGWTSALGPVEGSSCVFRVADADPSADIIGMGGRNFAGVVAAVNNVALNTVPTDQPNMPGLINAPGRSDPYPRNLGPGASVAEVGRLYDSDGDGTLDAIDDQIQWAFSTIYVRGLAPDGTPALVPFKKLQRIRYLDVDARVGPDVPSGDPIVYYITIADDEGVYPVTYYPATGPWAAPPASSAFPGFAVLALPPAAAPFDAGSDGYGATWWLDGQEYATAMGALGRGMDPDPANPGPDEMPVWSAAGTPKYPVEYTGTCAGPGTTLQQDTTFSFFRPVHVERERSGHYLITNGHERKGEVLLVNPYVFDPAGADPSMNPQRRYDLDYLQVLNWIVPDPVEYIRAQNPNYPDIGGETYSLGQPWAATRRQDF